MKVFLVMKGGFDQYPPAISLINILCDLGIKPICIGETTNANTRSSFESKGVVFYDVISTIGISDPISQFRVAIKFKKQVKHYVKQNVNPQTDIVWIIKEDTISLLHDIVSSYKCILHFYEFTLDISLKYKILNPGFSLKKTMKEAYKVVHCNYDRASIIWGTFGLDSIPEVMPNKPYVDDFSTDVIPSELHATIEKIKNLTENKKTLLYQGAFNTKERRLEEFCQTVNELDDSYVLLVLGFGSSYYDNLKRKYESKKIIFIPQIDPPYHLLITKLAQIGILTYYPNFGSVDGAINPLYCAPNKIFEYGKFGLPMLSNKIPGLLSIFNTYHCGECIEMPLNISNIKEAIEKIFTDYDSYSKGAIRYYNSIDMKIIVKKILFS